MGEQETDLDGQAVPSMPNVYFSYPSSSGGPIEQAREEPQSGRPQSGRPKWRSRTASAKRPSSARKGSRKEEDASKIKSHFLSFDEAQELVRTRTPRTRNPEPGTRNPEPTPVSLSLSEPSALFCFTFRPVRTRMTCMCHVLVMYQCGGRMSMPPCFVTRLTP